jgi:hypothetical protein
LGCFLQDDLGWCLQWWHKEGARECQMHSAASWSWMHMRQAAFIKLKLWGALAGQRGMRFVYVDT